MKKVCYFGIYDPQHWRSRILSRGFRRAGFEVIECRINPREVKGIKKYFELYKKYKALRQNKFDYIVVGFPGYFIVFLAYVISSVPIIFDAYISYFDGVRDRRNYSLLHPKMWFAWCVDFVDGLCSEAVLVLNYTSKDFFVKTLKVKASKVEVLHKGADEAVFFPRQENRPKKKDKYIIGWWGSFIPLHGIPVIIDAANVLRHDDNIKFQIIGYGQLAQSIKKQLEALGLSNVSLIPFIPQNQLVEKILEFDIALGIFSATPKAGRCITNKVFEAIAMGKPVITQDSKANREIFTHKLNAYLVPPGDPKALANAIKELIQNKELRDTIAHNAVKLFRDNFVSEKIEKELIDIIKRHER